MTDHAGTTPDTHFVRNAAGTRIGLHRYSSGAAQSHPVILSHGSFSNHRSCRGLAQFLARRGYDSWAFDFQGHGISDRPAQEPDFETMCLQDTAAVINFISERYPGQKLSWVGHSGGGLAILMHLCRHPDQQSKFASIVTLASQATDAGLKPLNRAAIRAASLLTAALRIAPGKWLGLGPEHEFAGVMQQWYGWSLTQNWLGADDFDYIAALSNLKLPVLTLAAAGDWFIAPVSGCQKLYEQYARDSRQWQLCGRQTGYSEDYTHARIISSRAAASEIWPAIGEWISCKLDAT